MSRIGRKPIPVPANVNLTVQGPVVRAVGPKGELTVAMLPGLSLKQEDGIMNVIKVEDTPETQRSYGLMRTLINNIVVGVSEGYTRQLEINGVGYRASVAGTTVNLSLGYSHPIAFPLPAGIEAKMERNVLTISGSDKQAVGQVAANIRALRKPEPYKGKGIKYIEEHIRRKAGKTAAKG